MYLNRTCPLSENKLTMKIGGQPFECADQKCRFQIEGVCAIIGSLYEARENRILLNRIAEKVGVKL